MNYGVISMFIKSRACLLALYLPQLAAFSISSSFQRRKYN